MEYMAREVSWETFINAVYQPGAFRNLYMAFEKKFGRFSLFVFAKIIKDPEKVKLFIENFSYRSLFLKNEALRIENIREQSVTSFQDKG